MEPRPSSLAFVLACCTGLLTLVSCEDESGAGAGSRFEVRDSAGVAIVENHPEVWPPNEVWHLPDTPRVQIGVREGDPGYELYGVTGAVTLTDGRIVVGEFGVRIRYYDREGQHLETLDRAGEGPGEVQLISRLTKYRGDSLLVWADQMGGGRRSLNRFLVLSADGEFGRYVDVWYPSRGEDSDTSQWLGRRDGSGVQGTLEDGSFIVEGVGEMIFPESVGSTMRSWAPLLHFDAVGQFVDTIDVVAIDEDQYRPNNTANVGFILGGLSAPPPEAHGMKAYWAAGEHAYVTVYERGTRTVVSNDPVSVAWSRRSVRVHAGRVAFEERHRDHWVESVLDIYEIPGTESSPQRRADDRERYAGMASPDSIQVVRDLMVDAEGNVWLELQESLLGWMEMQDARQRGVPTANEDPTWVVLNPEGQLVGSVRTPRDLQITEIGADYVMGIFTDEYGVQYVRVYPIGK